MRALASTLAATLVASALVACAHRSTTQAGTTPAPAPAPATPLVTQPVTTSNPTVRATLPPAPALSAAPVVVTASSDPAGPRIISVATSPSIVHSGEAVTWNVRTSTDVVSVTAHVSAYTLPLQPQGPGRFFLGFTIPSTVPAVFHGTYSLELTARTQSGATSKRDVPMIFQ
jgi:hypothetical protein